MKNNSTIEDIRRLSFVENLYKEIRQQTQEAIKDHDSLIVKASEYLEDGLSKSECSELLVIDGISREAAESYIQLAQTNQIPMTGRYEYSFQFEDVYGKIWSSYDINHTVYASSDKEAWEKAEATMLSDSSIEPERIISVNKVS